MTRALRRAREQRDDARTEAEHYRTAYEAAVAQLMAVMEAVEA